MIHYAKVKSNIARISGLLFGIIIFIEITQLLNRMYVSYSYASEAWGYILWHQFYENDGKIDNLYLGSSHVYCDIDPEILDEITGECNFNLSSPGQVLDGSYYLLKEADKNNRLSHVYLELYYEQNQNDTRINQLYFNWHNTDYMHWSWNKVAYMLSIRGDRSIINTLFPYTRYREYTGRWDYFTKVLAQKKEEDYRNYHWENDLGENRRRLLIREKGFMESTGVFEDESKYKPLQMDLRETSMGERSKKYCRKIMEYCIRNEIPITLFVSPVNDLALISTQDYDAYLKEIRELAAEYDLTVWDFNLAKEQYLPLNSKHYLDADHLNANGASLYTPFFYEVVSGGKEDNEKFFYESYEEKLQKTAPAIYGAYYKDCHVEDFTAEEQTRSVWIASNRVSGMEYKIILTPDEGEQYMIQDFRENKEFRVPTEEHGICMIVARMKDNPDEVVQTMEVRY